MNLNEQERGWHKMFTGIVEEIGTIRSVQPHRLDISAKKVLEGTKEGDSISVNGACLTIIVLGSNSFSVDVMPETLHRTNLGSLHVNQKVNLERALTLESRLGGHFVQGHIDGTGRILSIKPEDRASLMRVGTTPEIMRYVVEKGFIAIDGVSLTTVASDSASFGVSLVTYTLQNTILGLKRVGEVVNLEVDIVAKYVEQFVRNKNKSSGVTLEFLSEHGFFK
jgi:riboflavin synthase